MSDIPLLSHAIPDTLRESGHDDLAEAAVRLAEWIDLARPVVRRADIAGEDISMGDILSRGPDELIYRARSPIPVQGVVGASKGDTRKGKRVDYLTPRDYRGLLDGDPREIDEVIDRAFKAAMERVERMVR